MASTFLYTLPLYISSFFNGDFQNLSWHCFQSQVSWLDDEWVWNQGIPEFSLLRSIKKWHVSPFSDTPIYHMKLVEMVGHSPIAPGFWQAALWQNPMNQAESSSTQVLHRYAMVKWVNRDLYSNCKDPIVGWMTMPHVLSFDHGASFNFTMDDGNGSHCGV